VPAAVGDGHDPSRYGEAVGASYDELYPAEGLDTDAAVASLAELARAHPARAVLEMAIGTGRLALPLLSFDLRVAGIDASPRMLETLQAKPRGTEIEVVVGDYASARVESEFSVVLLAFNGIFDPRGRSVQLQIFRNAARHLGSGGWFVVEGFVLSDSQRSGEWMVTPRYVGGEHVELQLARFDLGTNEIQRTLVHLRPHGLQFFTSSDVYAAPGELDVMAEVAGFRLATRSAGWQAEPFTASSAKHVSVYELVG
jgi:predicted TPR repeat methyltransferase